MDNFRLPPLATLAGQLCLALAPAWRSTTPRSLAPQPAAAGPPLGTPSGVCRHRGLSLLALAASLAWPAHAVPQGVARSQPKPLGCLIEPDRVAEVGSQVVGVVEQLKVQRGEQVSAGQPLLSLRADVERANAQTADARARINADVLAAQASLDLAQQKVQRAESLVAQNFVSEQAAEQARGEAEVARQRVQQVRGQLRVWAGERQVADAQLALRTVRSPFAGVVVERYINPGERVEDKPLMRVAVIDPLRVELLVPTAQYGAWVVGDQVSIQPELPGAGVVLATVRHVDRVLDAASNSFRVRLSLPNPGSRLPAGLRCKAELPLAGSAPPARRPVPLRGMTLELGAWPAPRVGLSPHG